MSLQSPHHPGRPRPPRLLRPGHALWLVVIGLLWWGYSTHGLPHLLWSYSYVTSGADRWDWSARYYTQCRYIGFHGSAALLNPTDGRCPLIVFRQAQPEGGAQ